MPRNAWLTPGTPGAGFICRRLLIPNGIDWLAIVAGALDPLRFSSSFEQFGTQTPANTAKLFRDMFDKFSFDEGEECRLIGEIICFAGPISPSTNWLICDGSSLSRSTYPDLFAVVGTAYGAVDGAHFSIPDLRGRLPLGVGTGPGLTPRALGDSFGEEAHQLVVSELASHSHTDAGHTHAEGTASPTAILVGVGAPAPSAIPSVGVTAAGNASIQASGADIPHNTMQPSLAISFFIVAL